MNLNGTYLAALCLSAATIAACAGGAQNSPISSLPAGSMMQQVSPLDHQGCQTDGNISVVPCSIKFTAKNPGPVNVTVTRNGDGNRNRGRIRERDDCTSRGIATIARDSKDVYTVTAGSTTGVCDAEFSTGGQHNDDGGRNGGSGRLHIVNDI